MSEKYEAALLSIAGIAKDRMNTTDPCILYLFLEEIQRIAEDALHDTEVPNTFRAAFEEDV